MDCTFTADYQSTNIVWLQVLLQAEGPRQQNTRKFLKGCRAFMLSCSGLFYLYQLVGQTQLSQPSTLFFLK